MQTQIVDVLINVTHDEDSKIHDGKPKFSGDYVMRALNAAGAVLHEARLTVRDLDVPTSDYARLLTLRAALERLHSKLRGDQAGYALRVVQASNNVDGWLSHGWKRVTSGFTRSSSRPRPSRSTKKPTTATITTGSRTTGSTRRAKLNRGCQSSF